ncbi:hypothetical protein [uncultured Intestinimonas sp.]|uniref:hypothetical protein n=1 Tax=uncultured Intestinimonas sp. TaxID=1689265 RepID=UPI0025F649D5|nr:hypothetical protein [uncultured Intestinimonas sp.]
MITFPTTPGAFIAYQERLIGRELTDREREVMAAWVERFNLSYEYGLRRDRAALEISLNKIDELIAKREEDPAVRKFLQAARQCINHAWECGMCKTQKIR